MTWKRQTLSALGSILLLGPAACSDDDAGQRDATIPEDGSVVPAETADEESLVRLHDWRALPVHQAGSYRQQSSWDRGSGGPAPLPLLENGNRDLNHFVCASADADIDGPAMIPLVFDLDACPDPGVRGFVVARFEGSGRLTRLWMTAMSFRTSPPDLELLRIYVDDTSTPLIRVPLAEVFDGSAGELFGPPFGAGSTHYLAWYYPVVFSHRLIVTLDHLDSLDAYYHQTDVVLDAVSTTRRAATDRLDARDDVLALLNAGPVATGDATSRTLHLRPDVPRIALDLPGPGTIETVTVTISATELAELDTVTLDATWDDEGQPAIHLPLLDLFGASLDVPENSSLALAVTRDGSDIQLQLRLPMPFETRAHLSLIQQGGSAVTVTFNASITDTVPAAPWGRLHVQRNETVGPVSDPDHPLVAAAGPGRLVGVCLMMEGHALDNLGLMSDPLNFLEGDERGTVDGELALVGTGTEDYLNGAFYFEEGAAATPFAQWWGLLRDDSVTPARGRASACRWHVLGDAIDFQHSMDLDLEIGPGVPSVLDRYRSVAFLYL